MTALVQDRRGATGGGIRERGGRCRRVADCGCASRGGGPVDPAIQHEGLPGRYASGFKSLQRAGAAFLAAYPRMPVPAYSIVTKSETTNTSKALLQTWHCSPRTVRYPGRSIAARRCNRAGVEIPGYRVVGSLRGGTAVRQVVRLDDPRWDGQDSISTRRATGSGVSVRLRGSGRRACYAYRSAMITTSHGASFIV